MELKKIGEDAYEKISDRDLYEMIVGTGWVTVAGGKVYIFLYDGVWHQKGDIDAIIAIRDFFENPLWQSSLSAERMRRILATIKTDPNIQRNENEFHHEDLIKIGGGMWNIKNSRNTITTKKINGEVKVASFSRMIPVRLSNELPDESRVFLNFCKKVFSPEKFERKKRMLYEIIGFCISDIENVKKAIFLIGRANCGKSVILRFIQRLVGEENYSNVSLDRFANNFHIFRLLGKVVNVSGEIPSTPLSGRAFDVFKCITGGDRMELEKKGQQPFSGVIKAKLIFAGNMMPSFAKVDGTDSFVERLHILLFDNSVPKDEIDLGIEERLWSDRDKIVRYSMEALKYFVIGGKKFIESDDELEMLRSIADSANPLKSFVESCLEFGDGFAVHISEVYEAYLDFAWNEALPDIQRTTFRNLMGIVKGITIGKTKKRLGKPNPQSVFLGIRLKNSSPEKKARYRNEIQFERRSESK